MKKIGVLALQGAFAEHIAVFQRLGAEARPVRTAAELEGMDGLVIPGGESTTISKLMAEYGLTSRIRELVGQGFPVFGTCAGLILLAQRAIGLDNGTVGAVDIVVRRNAFGRQVDSFETDLVLPALGSEPFRAVFIRAPVIESVGDGAEVLARLPDGTPVAARQGRALVCAFHPELTADTRLHAYFLEMLSDGERGG